MGEVNPYNSVMNLHLPEIPFVVRRAFLVAGGVEEQTVKAPVRCIFSHMHGGAQIDVLPCVNVDYHQWIIP